MIKLFFNFIIPALLLFSCNLIPEKQGPILPGELHKEFYPSGKLKSVCQVEEKRRNGICNTYDEQGRLTSTAHYVNNKFDGTFTTFYQNGNKKTEVNYLDHKKHGVASHYYASGKIKVIENYESGSLNGIKQKFYPNGNIKMENMYENGKPSVNLKEYDVNGNLKSIDKPKIVISKVDRAALDNTYTLKLSLSNNSKRVKYYFGTLTEHGYTPSFMEPISTKNGVGTYVIPVYRGTMIMKKLHIIAKWKTPEQGNTCLLTTSYNLAIKY